MATDFSYGNTLIGASGPFKPTGKNIPLDARTRVETFSEITTITNPYVGMLITVLNDETNSGKMTDYKVKSLKANSVGIANTVINEVVRYVDYLGVSSSSGGTSAGTGEGLTTEQAQQLTTAYEHSQSKHVSMNEVNQAIANAQLSGGEVDLSTYATKTYTDNAISTALDGHTFKFLTQAEYDALTTKDPLVEYHITDATDNNNIDTSNLASNLSLTGTKLQLKNSQGNLIGNAVTLPLTSSTVTAFLNGKKYCAIGDSITYGVNTTKKYHEYLKEYFNLNSVTNLGKDGSTITSKSSGICDRIANIPKDSDLITLFAGTNDFFYAMPIGEWYTKDSSNRRTLIKDKTTFRGALNIICEYLIDNFSNKLIYLMTPIHRYKFMTQPTDLEPNSGGLYLEEYVNCIIECGKIHSLPVIDLYSKSGLLPSNTNNANLYFNPTSDYLHPNATGHKKIAQVIYKEIVNDMLLGSDYTPVVKTLSRISATYNQGSTTVYPSTSLDTLKTNLIVKAIYSDNSEDVVTTYNLSGTLSVGTSQITVTYSNKTTTFNVNVSKEQVATKTLSSISAVYTQGSTVVYPYSSLDSLKDNLVVTATYSDDSTSTVTDYNLSGTLSVGTSQITVTYSDKTTTFDVIVTESTNTYRAVTEDDLTLINSTLTIDDNGYKITTTKAWDGVRLTNVPKESKITLLQTNAGQCIWYMYKCDSDYMHVLSIGSGNGEHGKAYKLGITNPSPVTNGTVSMTMTPAVGDVLKVVVDGSTQTLYCNDTKLCTLTDCNTVGISNQSASNKYLASKWEVLY